MKLFAFASRQPELQRQLWLEFSLARGVAMPAVLAILFIAVALGGAGALAIAAQTGFLALVWAYGARLANAAVLDEVTEGTWDAQRLSSLTPWQLTLGKLAGGTALAWYGGLLCLAVWWMAESAQGHAPPLLRTVAMVAGGIAMQAASLVMALAAARRSSGGTRRGSGWWVLLSIVLLWAGVLSTAGGQPIVWWGIAWPQALFVTAMAVVFAGWAVLGAWRMMAAALQVPLRPVMGVAFLVWLAVFFAGWLDVGSALWRFASLLTVIASMAAYATLFFEPPLIDMAQRLVTRWRDTGWSCTTQQRLPLMAASTVVSLLAGAAAVALAPRGGLTDGMTAAALNLNAQHTTGLRQLLATAGLAAGAPLALALLTLRDMALACALHWSRDVRRAEGATLVLLAVVNLVLPWLLFTAGAPMLAVWMQPALGLFGAGSENAGMAGSGELIALLTAALQAVVASAWARQRWRAAQPAGSSGL